MGRPCVPLVSVINDGKGPALARPDTCDAPQRRPRRLTTNRFSTRAETAAIDLAPASKETNILACFGSSRFVAKPFLEARSVV